MTEFGSREHEPTIPAPRRTQRLGAYAVVLRDDALLLTRISPSGFPVGYWALPGGGVDHGESPHNAVRRELYEETGLTASEVRLVDIHSLRVIDRGRTDAYEDYHGVHVLYAVSVEPGVEPQVIEVDGTTDEAAWVPIDTVSTLSTLPVVDYVIERLADYRA
ncbi:NUDIX hydrolase [uncultured Aeromicrobium sp.]|uniref:NUDIX hydrolase n=1 Tax=uncultured Aeromicrobium sp. TaxID=337820 RepID=UPI0025D3A9AE|nr:NUDIX domain-containing protein [uncultured Aeromicrobium sp.]